MTTSIINQTQLERDILASIMLPSAKNAPSAMADLRLEYFALPQHRLIFKAILQLFDRNSEVDIVSVSEELIKMGRLDEAGGRAYVSEIVVSCTGLVDHLSPAYVDALIERYKGGEMVKLMDELEKAYSNDADADTLMALARGKLEKLGTLKKADKPVKAVQIFDTIGEHIKMAQEMGGVPGIKSGYPQIDHLTNGFGPCQFIIIAGRPGSCKTTLALNLALNMAKIEKKRILFYSLEMPNEQLNMRLISLLANVNFQAIKKGTLTDDEQERIERAGHELRNIELHFCDSSNVSVHTIKSHVDSAKRAGTPYDAIYIDYLQLMAIRKRKDDNRNLEVGEISRGIKLLANEEKIPIFALSQLNRGVELRQDKRPMMSDLRDSGTLEQDADLVIGLYREEYYNENTDRKGDMEVLLLKNRHGDTGTVILRFERSKCALHTRY